jgi:hypothetical protein
MTFFAVSVDQDGFVLEVLVQKRRDAKAARRLIWRDIAGVLSAQSLHHTSIPIREQVTVTLPWERV